MAEDVLKKIQTTEQQANDIIAKANDEAKQIARDIDAKILNDGNKIISDLKAELDARKDAKIAEATQSANIHIEKESENIRSILNTDQSKISEVARILRGRVVE